MSLTPYISGDTATSNIPIKGNTGVRLNPGPYVGIVKSNIDPTRMGRLGVLIPAIAETQDPSSGQLITCSYLTPFYGAKSTRFLEEGNPYDYKSSQHSYGMWMVPPDIDTKVLVIFAEGRTDQAYWIGCIQEPLMNHMVPGIAASQATGLSSDASDDDTKQSTYGTDNVPAGEVNRATLDSLGDQSIDPKLKRPIHPQAELLRAQGLVQDPVRGTTTSSARRESPSQVFGISTPGRRDPSAKDRTVGVRDSKRKEKIDRLTGHSFVMDDGDITGRNHLIRLRSATGHQILLNDTAGVVYIANGSGNAWMEFANDGSIDFYSGGSVAVRSSGNMDFHSDANINMFAKQEIKLASGSRMVLDGGENMMIYAEGTINQQSTKGVITTKAPEGSIISYARDLQLHMTSGEHHLTGEEVHFNSVPTMSDIIGTFYRTRFYDTSGTGTLNVATPDIDLKTKNGGAPLTVNNEGNITMDGMRVPTHEPFFAHRDQIVSFAGGKPSSLATVPGTPEFVAQLNRTSDNPFIQAAQLQADLKVHLEEQGLGEGTTNIAKLQSVSKKFTDNYTKNFNLPNIPTSILKVQDSVSSVVNQTIGSITGDVKNLLQNQIFVNQGGKLFTAGNLNQSISGTVTGAINDLTSVDNFVASAGNILNTNLPNVVTGITGNQNIGNLTGNLTSTITNVTGITGNVNIGNITGVPGNIASGLTNVSKAINVGGLTNIPGAGTVNTVTNTYKNVVGSSVTAVTQVTSLVNNIGSKVASVGRSIGKMFGF